MLWRLLRSVVALTIVPTGERVKGVTTGRALNWNPSLPAGDVVVVVDDVRSGVDGGVAVLVVSAIVSDSA